MNPVELTFGILLVVLLLGLAGFFAWRQKRTIEQLRQDDLLSQEDRVYLAGQVSRRLMSSILMLVLAGFLVGWYYLEDDFRQLQPNMDNAVPGQAEGGAWKDELRFYVGYWIAALLVLLSIMALAAYDLLATARFGLRHHQQLQSARRALLESEAARLRQGRSDLN